MITYRKSMALATLTLALLTPAYAAEVAGSWKAEFDTQIGVQKYTYEFKANGTAITGKATFEREQDKGEVPLKEIKVTGDDIAFVEPMNFDGNEVRIEYKGKIAGDEMKLTRQVGEFATEDLVAKRVKEGAAKPAPSKPADVPPPK